MKKVKSTTTYNCSNCAISETCPKFKEGAACSLDPSTPVDPEKFLDELFQTTVRRYRHGILSERLMSGGYLDTNVTKLGVEVKRLADRLITLRRKK